VLWFRFSRHREAPGFGGNRFLCPGVSTIYGQWMKLCIMCYSYRGEIHGC